MTPVRWSMRWHREHLGLVCVYVLHHICCPESLSTGALHWYQQRSRPKTGVLLTRDLQLLCQTSRALLQQDQKEPVLLANSITGSGMSRPAAYSVELQAFKSSKDPEAPARSSSNPCKQSPLPHSPLIFGRQLPVASQCALHRTCKSSKRKPARRQSFTKAASPLFCPDDTSAADRVCLFQS